MLSYVIRRLAGAIPTLLIIIAATFFLMRLAPGGPFDGEFPHQHLRHRNEKDYPCAWPNLNAERRTQ